MNNLPKIPTPEMEDLFIFGEPVETFYGTFKFLDYKEYNQSIIDLSIISFSMLKFYYMYRENLIEQKASKKDLVDLMGLKEVELYDFLREDYVRKKEYQQNTGIQTDAYLESYMRVFNKMITNINIPDFSDPVVYFGSETKQPMSLEDFYNIRNTVMRMNLVKEEQMSPSPRVQKYLDKSKAMKAKNSEPPNTTTIMTSIFLHTGTPYAELNKMTAYQIVSTYARIHSIKDFEISALFATVSPDVKISRWDINNDLLKEEEVGLDLSKAQKNFENMMK